jgi:hypothetical protein
VGILYVLQEKHYHGIDGLMLATKPMVVACHHR